ncbi:DnaJ domain containing protein [Trema orientale]|uniref:DnaJ domain containing protein n=1 Tax=Trema orientale TaxID=63057 RepID=A0A2P5FAF8_TREOI|nr:DnaJ domain containing protein [Trema orientale]
MGDEEGGEQEAKRMKALADAKYKASNLKSALKYAKRAHRLCPNLDGVSSMVTSFKILRAASKSSPPDWYKILQAEPFCHVNTIKKQYKKLAFLLHPDKNPHLGSEEAFKLVNEGFRFLSDKVRRKEYDMRLRIRIQDEKMKESVEPAVSSETFWTACSTCRLLHQFERKYLGHNLVCPSCRKSFQAMEVGNDENDKDNGRVRSERLRMRNLDADERIAGWISKSKLGNLGLGKGRMGSGEIGDRRAKSVELKKKGEEESGNLKKDVGGGGEWSGGRLRKRMSSVGDVMERSQLKRAKIDEEMMTLAEMQSEVRRKAKQEKMRLKLREDERKEKEKEKEKEKAREREKKKKESEKERCEVSKERRDLKVERLLALKKSKDLGSLTCGAFAKSRDLSLERHKVSKESEPGIMAVEDSDFYDFDKDRMERSFKQGQVWAMYADDDGMPRDYGLIDEVVSVNPFEVKLSWLDLQNSGDEELLCWERRGFHVSCGRFKVSRKTSVDSVNIFSHVVDCERAAREIYRIYPKKGSVWALYAESTLSAEGRNLSLNDRQPHYDIVVFLTTYSEMHGLSMAYLEKVDGFKTIFKRHEIGSHAIRWLEKDDVGLFSHQIPARKLSGDEVPELLKDCWELDPASLPADLHKT